MYEKPILDDSFDRIAAMQMRAWMQHYDKAPSIVKSILENIAICQIVEREATPPATPAP